MIDWSDAALVDPAYDIGLDGNPVGPARRRAYRFVMPCRIVTLVLCTEDGELLGALPPFEVPTPWWQDIDDVVVGARQEHRLDVRILRLLTCQGDNDPGGGPVSYLAEVDQRPGITLTEWPGDPLAEQPLRLSYAKPGGHRADLLWAQDVLSARGLTMTAAPQQVRTWNLSSVWRLPTDGGGAWLKVVPPFFAHEASLLPLLDPEVVPPVLGSDFCRVLLGEVPGEDQYGATGESQLEMVRMLVRLQVGWIGRTEELRTIGLPDLREASIAPLIEDAVGRHRRELTGNERHRVDAILRGMPARFTAITECGLPETLVHGDFHPGNVRGVPGRFAILDWGDSAVGHPMIDQLAFGQRLQPADRAAAEGLWAREWQRVVPGCDAGRAATLLRPVTALYGAVIYQRFLDNIEPDEHPYHRGDPLNALRHAAAIAD